MPNRARPSWKEGKSKYTAAVGPAHPLPNQLWHGCDKPKSTLVQPESSPCRMLTRFKVKCQAIGHGCVICPVKLAVINDHFGTRADVILRRYLVPRLFTLNLNFQVKWQGMRSWLCKLLTEASYHFERIWYTF